MPNATVTCPHCSAPNPPGSAFCEACGKALPTASAGPRIVTGDVAPISSAGQQLLSEDLNKQTKKAAYALLAVGLIQLVCGIGVLVALSRMAPAGAQAVNFLIVAQLVIGCVFIGLYFWARRSPLPASIVGLTIYCTLVLVNMVTAISRMNQGGPRTGFGGLGIGILDIVIIVLLAQGIQAGLKHKKLLAGAAA